MRLILWMIVGFLGGAVCFGQATEIRYPDAVYLDDIHAKPLPLKTVRPAKFTASRDGSTALANLGKGETVWVLGFADERTYVEADTSKGRARGWIDRDALEPAPEEVGAEIERQMRASRRVAELVAKHEVGQGMTRAQVLAAIGKPDDRSRTQQGGVVNEQWIYRTYQNVPHRESFDVDGRSYERTYYRKVLVDGKTVTFRNDEVVAVKNEDTATAPGADVPGAAPAVIYP